MLLRTVLLLFLASLTACDPSVIIIGAGASGIAAATRLLKNGFTNVTVLEAEDRIGGRVYSVPLGNGYVDLGAEWCAGEEGNVVYDLVKDLNVLRVRPITQPQIYHFDLKKIDTNFSSDLMKTFEDLYYKPEKTNGSLGEYLIKRYEEVIRRWEYDAGKYAVAQQAVKLFESYVALNEGAFSWFDVVADNDNLERGGDYNLHWNGLGFKTIFDVLMGKYPDPSKALPLDDKILLKKIVKEVSWKGKKAVVTCVDDSTYYADHVVVTVSLGVLKNGYNTLFKPPLPLDKVLAIDNLGIAAVHKMSLHFPQKWWNENFIVCFVWTNGTEERKPWITSLSSIKSMSHNPNVLEAWFSGMSVRNIEYASNEAVVSEIMYALTHFGVVDPKVLVAPDGVVRNNWYTNPNFRGTYSFQTPHCRRGDNSDEVILSKPLGDDLQRPKLLFAGEATSPRNYGSVHGAIETGFREADRIIQMYKTQ